MPLSMLWLASPPTLGEVASDSAVLSSTQKVLSLGQAQRIALERNWDLLAAAKGIDAATAQKPTSGSRPAKSPVPTKPKSTLPPSGSSWKPRRPNRLQHKTELLWRFSWVRGIRKATSC